MKKEYVKPQSEAINLMMEGPIALSGDDTPGITDQEKPIDPQSNRQDFGKELWE